MICAPFTLFIALAYHKCKRPCTDIEYKIGKDSYILGTPDENSVRSGCQPGEGVINLQFSRLWKYKKVYSFYIISYFFLIVESMQEDYIVHQVNLLSGFGGAMGLWLGWSILTLGELIVTFIKTLKTISDTYK